jgi:Leucine-rich repeat (LRR) protein
MKKATFKETEATYEDKLAMIMAVGDATIEEASRALEECGGDINHALAFVNNQAPTPSTGTASSSSSLHNVPYKRSKTARRIEDVDDESIAKPRESLRHAPTLVARRQPFVAAAAAPKGPKENVFHAPISSAASHPQHHSLGAAAASALSQGGGRLPIPEPPQGTALPGAFAVGGSNASQTVDDGEHTITSRLPENISATQLPTQQVVPVTARLVVDTSDDYVESLEQEIERMRQNQENIVVGQVLGVDNNNDEPNDEEGATNNANTITPNNSKPIFSSKHLVVIGVIAVLAIIAVIVGVAVAASSNSQQNASESQSSPQSPTLLPTFAPTAAPTSTTQSPTPLCDESSSSLAKRLPCYSQNKTWLDLYDNSLTGMIPSQLGLLTKLTYLSLSWNSLTGTIPSEVGLLTKLTYLNLSFNSLTGTIPSQVGLLSNLTELSLSSNSLRGTIPSEVGLMWNLSELYLHRNSLTGMIPSQIALLSNLDELWLYSNSLTGTIPSQIALLSNLYLLLLYNNNFTGEFTCPAFIDDCCCWISCDSIADTYTQACRSL